MKKIVALAMLLVALVGSTGFLVNVFATQKFFSAKITPVTGFSQQKQVYSLTITNEQSNPNGNKMGSVIITIEKAAGWEIEDEINTNDSSWQADLFLPNQINVTASSSADCISPGESIVVSFAARAPSVTEAHNYTWLTVAFTSPSWAGDLFTLARGTSQPVVTVTQLLYYITFYKSGTETTNVNVNYTIDGKNPTVVSVPSGGVVVPVEGGKTITYNYSATVSNTLGSLYSLTLTDPESLPPIVGNVQVTGYYDKSFGITGLSGDITVQTSSLPGDSTANLVPGLPPIPDGVLGSYYIVDITGTPRGTFTITIHYDDTGLNETQEQNLRLYMGDAVDFNGDGKVDGNDVNMTQNAIRSNDLAFDINNDGHVDKTDLRIVQQYANSGILLPSSDPGGQTRLPWIDITTGIDTTKNEIYGETDHFSGFGVH